MEHEWNSNGWCHDRCKEKGTAFAIVQFTSCFCSDWIPLEQIGGENCQKPCPGFPTEQCGDQEKGTYGYIAIAGKKPAGTLGASTVSVPPSSIFILFPSSSTSTSFPATSSIVESSSASLSSSSLSSSSLPRFDNTTIYVVTSTSVVVVSSWITLSTLVAVSSFLVIASPVPQLRLLGHCFSDPFVRLLWLHPL